MAHGRIYRVAAFWDYPVSDYESAKDARRTAKLDAKFFLEKLLASGIQPDDVIIRGDEFFYDRNDDDDLG